MPAICGFDLLALGFGTRVRVISHHAQPVAVRQLVAQRLLPDQRIDVGVLQERGEGIAPEHDDRQINLVLPDRS